MHGPRLMCAGVAVVGVNHQIAATKRETCHVPFLGTELPAEHFAVEVFAPRQIRHEREYVKDALDCHVLFLSAAAFTLTIVTFSLTMQEVAQCFPLSSMLRRR